MSLCLVGRAPFPGIIEWFTCTLTLPFLRDIHGTLDGDP